MLNRDFKLNHMLRIFKNLAVQKEFGIAHVLSNSPESFWLVGDVLHDHLKLSNPYTKNYTFYLQLSKMCELDALVQCFKNHDITHTIVLNKNENEFYNKSNVWATLSFVMMDKENKNNLEEIVIAIGPVLPIDFIVQEIPVNVSQVGLDVSVLSNVSKPWTTQDIEALLWKSMFYKKAEIDKNILMTRPELKEDSGLYKNVLLPHLTTLYKDYKSLGYQWVNMCPTRPTIH